MPNYVRNKITFRGKEDNVKKVLDAICSKKRGAIDFNKIISVPETLNMVSGSLTDDAILTYLLDNFKKCATKNDVITYLAYTDPMGMWKAKRMGLYDLGHFVITTNLVDYFNNSFDYCYEASQIEKRKERLIAEGLDKKVDFSTDESKLEMTYYEAGKQYIENIKKYGSATWYNWCAENWGTEWNACEAQMWEDNTLRFSTAWSAPEPVIEHLAMICEKNGVEFNGCSADEDTGSNVCEYSFTKDGYLFEYLKNGSPEAYAVYEEVWGSLDDDPCFGRDGFGTPFHYDCETCPNKDKC